MKSGSSTKKMMLVMTVVLCALVLSGCKVPTDATGAIKQITMDTSFQEIMSSENWFSAILVWPMAWLINSLTPKVGVILAITIVTILVNGILLAVTMRSQIDMQEMQLLQPEMDKIQRKYEGMTDTASRTKQFGEMQALYAKHHVNPGAMFLVQFLQFPIIIAMYQAVQRASAVKTATVGAMSLETTIWNGMKSMQWEFFALFIIMGTAQFISMSLPMWINKRKAKKEAEKHHRKPETPRQSSQMQSMQYYMLAMILVFGLMWPAAMSVYWAIYSLVTIAKTFIVQKAIEKHRVGQEGRA